MSSHNKKIVPAGEIIMQQGDEGNCAYIIESGTVEILLEKERGLIQSLGTRGAGTIIGEMSIVDNNPRTATIKAIETCELLEISREDFNNRLENTDPVIQMITKVILSRYRDMITRAHILGSRTNFNELENFEKNLVESTNAVKNIKLASDLKQAINLNQLELNYQPIIDLKNNSISGFEALIRWPHPEKGMIYPDIFIPVAEDSGLIVEMSQWITKTACSALKRIQDKFARDDLFISVNFSAKDFTMPDFKFYVEKALKDNNLRTNQIHIEITERLLMAQPGHARAVLEECQKAGMIISIDDFGTGYSSLSYLHYFPIEILKIDRSFIENMETDKSSYELVKSIISLGHNMKMSIIAEGIETQTQADILKDMGCDKVQGYHFARPMDEQKLIEFMAQTL